MISKLLQYQQVDAKLKEIETELNQSEPRKKAASAKKFLDTVNDTLAKLEKRAEELNKVYANLLVEQKELLEEARGFENSADDIEDFGELNYITRKADELMNKINKIERNAEGLADEINSVFVQYAQLKKNTAQAKAQYSENIEKYKALQAARKEETDKIKEELNGIAKDIPDDIMQLYLAKRKDKMFPILYKLEGKMCSHCLMELSMAEIGKLNSGKLIECDNCSSLIYKE